MIEFFDIRPRLGLRIWGHIWGLEAIRLGCVLAFHAKFRVYAVITLILSTMCSQGGGNPGPVIPADSTSSASAKAVCYARNHALIHFFTSGGWKHTVRICAGLPRQVQGLRCDYTHPAHHVLTGRWKSGSSYPCRFNFFCFSQRGLLCSHSCSHPLLVLGATL